MYKSQRTSSQVMAEKSHQVGPANFKKSKPGYTKNRNNIKAELQNAMTKSSLSLRSGGFVKSVDQMVVKRNQNQSVDSQTYKVQKTTHALD